MKLFVCNITFTASEEAVRELFQQIGPLKRLYLATDRDGKSRGFGFIEYVDPLDASRALDDLHGKELMGRRLIVIESEERIRNGK